MRTKFLLLIAFSFLFISAGNLQINPPSDPFSKREEFYDSNNLTEVHFLFDNNGTVTFESQSPTGIVLENRPATTEETTSYIDYSNTQKAYLWVENRTTELESCENDMDAIVLLLEPLGGDFDSLGPNTKDSLISGIASCIEVNSRVNRITINKLLDMLVQNGINE